MQVSLNRPCICIVDANAYWTEQLFQQSGRFAHVLLLKPRDFRAHRSLTGTWRSHAAPQPVTDHVWEQRLSMPPGWMVEFWPWSQQRLARAVRQFAGAGPLTLVLTFPQYRGLIPAVKPARSVYCNFDDYRDNWPRHRARVPQWEAQLVETADLTLCTAAHRVNVLREQHPAKRECIHHLPNGCTPEFMEQGAGSSAQAASFNLPAPRSSLPAPRAGYIGALNYRFDFALLADVAARLPDVTFVLGGRVQEGGDAAWSVGLARARQLPNVTFLGWIDHAQLGKHLAGFDVLLMPYSRCHFNTNACPTKLWDYLGTGKPIVANDANPETLLWREVVYVGATPEAFARAIRAALTEPDTRLYERRLQIAREHTWEKLGQRLESILAAAPAHPRPSVSIRG
jgi:glycosyltransferase involved in cell wall biosynthesis